MLTSAHAWSELATEHGIVVDSPGQGAHGDLVLRGPDLPTTVYQVKTFSRPLRPAAVAQLAAEQAPWKRLLLFASSFTPDVARLAEEAGISVLATGSGRGVHGVLVDAAGRVHRLSPPPPARAPAPRGPGQVAWGTYAVAFALLETPGTQQALADRAGVSRVRVTQVLSQLDGLVTRTAAGWAPADHRELASWLAANYPATPRLATTWTVLDPPVNAAAYISRHLDILGVPHAVSGDVAADTWAPWARPASAWIWTSSLVDLAAVSATPAAPESATVTLAVSDDPHLLDAVRTTDDSPPLLAPWRVWVDLAHQGSTAAADALLNRLTR
ncbi:hypothetical protein [Actinotalea solisilvae]|uniref:hypothetical protein n=1 Tax=Actinotalea solisilvae TaxID=2072922 RepID=UPI0018F25328|nr:hypothetical protein [Actinotalea solisilvae]